VSETPGPLGDKFWELKWVDRSFLSFPALKRLIARSQASLHGGTESDWLQPAHGAIESTLESLPAETSVVDVVAQMDWPELERELLCRQVTDE